MLNNKDAANAHRILKGLLWVSVTPVKVSSELLLLLNENDAEL